MADRAGGIAYLKELMTAFNGIGVSEGNRTNRLGYSETEDQMHNLFAELGERLGCTAFTDEAGNTFVSNTSEAEYYLIGSHLDSVVDGGRYDGVAGVMAGLLLLKWCKEENLNIPLRVAAFRCEESSNFGCCTIGSGLITGEVFKVDLPSLISLDGKCLGEIFREKDFSFTPEPILGVKEYLELHIEQARVLEDSGLAVGIVGNIAGPRRLAITLKGMAEHSGATPMNLRKDALCGAAELILKIEEIGNGEAVHGSVATVGLLRNHPNVLNVIPGEVYLGVDLRGTDLSSIDRMEGLVRKAAIKITDKRELELSVENIGGVPPVQLSEEVSTGLKNAAQKLGISHRMMPSGATHDCATFAELCPTGMVFIPCYKGISHNPLEDCSAESICLGTEVLLEYLSGKEFLRS